jgi:hypothetical protein
MTANLLRSSLTSFWSEELHGDKQIGFSVIGIDYGQFPDRVWNGTDFIDVFNAGTDNVSSSSVYPIDPTVAIASNTTEAKVIQYLLGTGSLGIIADEYRVSFTDISPIHFKEETPTAHLDQIFIGNGNFTTNPVEGDTSQFTNINDGGNLDGSRNDKG